ncbi:MAG: ArnT family glycosyltransferase [Planctomycetaceae bacterium]
MNNPAPDSPSPIGTVARDSSARSCPWYGERELWLLLLVVSLIYLPWLHLPPLRGEETRRAMVGINMLETGDWIVPRQQGDPYFLSSRPPLQSWLMAATSRILGRFDLYAIRLPSVFALLLLLVVLYGYCRQFVSATGAFAAGAAYASMAQVLELGRTGESDLLFTLFVASSLLLWHAGYTQKWPAWKVWCLGYSAAALGTMTKGPQAPVYFAASVGLFLLVNRDWRYALTTSHLAGIITYLAIVSAWLIPFAMQMGLPGIRHVFTGDVVLYGNLQPAAFAQHLALYPLEIFACCFPWSLFLLNFAFRDFRSSLGNSKSAVLFLAGALAITFPTVWWVAGAKSRFYMSLYPCIAALAGIAVDRLLYAETLPTWIRNARLRFSIGMALVMFLAGPALLLLWWRNQTTLPTLPPAPTLFEAGLICLVGWLLGAALLYQRACATSSQFRTVLLGSLLFLGTTFGVVVVGDLTRRSSRVDLAVQKLVEQLPPDTKLVSFGPLHHMFTFHYYLYTGKRIEMLPIPKSAGELPEDLVYFCTSDPTFNDPGKRPFEFQQLANINCERFHRDVPGIVLVVAGKR